MIPSDDGKTCNSKATQWCKDSAAGKNHTAEETSCAIRQGYPVCYTDDMKCDNSGATKFLCNDDTSQRYTCMTFSDGITNLWVYSYVYDCDSGCNQATGKCN